MAFGDGDRRGTWLRRRPYVRSDSMALALIIPLLWIGYSLSRIADALEKE